jgi:hypothetical protein
MAMSTTDKILVGGAVVVGGYLIYQFFLKPTSDGSSEGVSGGYSMADQTSQLIQTTKETTRDVVNVITQGEKVIETVVESVGNVAKKGGDFIEKNQSNLSFSIAPLPMMLLKDPQTFSRINMPLVNMARDYPKQTMAAIMPLPTAVYSFVKTIISPSSSSNATQATPRLPDTSKNQGIPSSKAQQQRQSAEKQERAGIKPAAIVNGKKYYWV